MNKKTQTIKNCAPTSPAPSQSQQWVFHVPTHPVRWVVHGQSGYVQSDGSSPTGAAASCPAPTSTDLLKPKDLLVTCPTNLNIPSPVKATTEAVVVFCSQQPVPSFSRSGFYISPVKRLVPRNVYPEKLSSFLILQAN